MTTTLRAPTDRCPHCFAVLDPDALDQVDPVPPPRTRVAKGDRYSLEANVQHDVFARYGATPVGRFFRNSVGVATDQLTGRRVRFGLCKGSSDVIGVVTRDPIWARGSLDVLEMRLSSAGIYEPVIREAVAVVRQELVPRGLFAAIELKSATGTATEEQTNFVGMTQKFAGVGGFARNPDQFGRLISEATTQAPLKVGVR